MSLAFAPGKMKLRRVRKCEERQLLTVVFLVSKNGMDRVSDVGEELAIQAFEESIHIGSN